MLKQLISLAFALICAGTAFGQCPLNFTNSDHAAIGVYVVDLKSGKTLCDYNSDMLLTPASVMKSVTTAAALASKGGDYRWKTRVAAVGEVVNGCLNGDLIVFGSGDPTLGSENFKDEHPAFIQSVLNAAARKGITKITGVVRSAISWPEQGPIPSWELEDIPVPDGAGFYALNYADNTFVLSYPSMTATPHIPGLNVKNMGGSGGLWFTRYPGSTEIRVYGSLGKKQKRAIFKCSMPNPPEVLISELERVFKADKKKYTQLRDTIEIISFSSPALRDVTRSLMVRSDNQMAEATLRLLAPRQSRGTALKNERSILADRGINFQYARLADGSGLSRHNAVSARQLGSLLAAMASNADYVGSFARVGVDGTVRNFMKDKPGRENFILKSGSMTGVVCYVGYKLNAESKAPTHAIAIMVNNAPEPSKARAAIAAYLSSL